MKNESDIIKRKELESKLIEKAWKDEKFRNDLKINPDELIEKEFGFKIPQNPAESGGELTDAELDGVAGGDGTYLCTVSCGGGDCGYH